MRKLRQKRRRNLDMELLRCDRRGYQLISPRKTVPCWQAEGISRTGLEEVFRAELTSVRSSEIFSAAGGVVSLTTTTSRLLWGSLVSPKIPVTTYKFVLAEDAHCMCSNLYPNAKFAKYCSGATQTVLSCQLDQQGGCGACVRPGAPA